MEDSLESLEDYDSDSDDYNTQPKALDVEIAEDFDPNSVPQTGEEYIQHVMYERMNKCEKWVRASQDFTKYRKNQNVHVPVDAHTKKALDKFYPTKQWQENALKDFTEFCNFLKNSLPTCRRHKSIKLVELESRIETLGVEYSQLIQFSQAEKITILKNISENLSNRDRVYGINDNLGASIYGLLGLLEKPLTPDCCFVLREFAKICSDIRAKLTEADNEEVAVPLNLFICIISNCFNQLDLADR